MKTVILKALANLVVSLFKQYATQELLEKLLFKAAEAIAKSTETDKDDKWLADFVAAYKEGKQK